ncbi:hypothetical protein P7L78_22180 [Tistrella bauzanensis]|uniref:hypothetical protein n=1 Tax=Tistrella TaxID=171436 RepID=UPI0031F661CC
MTEIASRTAECSEDERGRCRDTCIKQITDAHASRRAYIALSIDQDKKADMTAHSTTAETLYLVGVAMIGLQRRLPDHIGDALGRALATALGSSHQVSADDIGHLLLALADATREVDMAERERAH